MWVTQMNHIVMEIDLDHYRDWFSSQVRDPAKPGPHCSCLHPDLATSVDPGLCWASLVSLRAKQEKVVGKIRDVAQLRLA